MFGANEYFIMIVLIGFILLLYSSFLYFNQLKKEKVKKEELKETEIRLVSDCCQDNKGIYSFKEIHKRVLESISGEKLSD